MTIPTVPGYPLSRYSIVAVLSHQVAGSVRPPRTPETGWSLVAISPHGSGGQTVFWALDSEAQGETARANAAESDRDVLRAKLEAAEKEEMAVRHELGQELADAMSASARFMKERDAALARAEKAERERDEAKTDAALAERCMREG